MTVRTDAEVARVLSRDHRDHRDHRAGLLALAVMFSAGIHAALVPEHLKEMPALGWSFIGAAALGAVLACALVVRPDDRGLARLAAVFLAAEVLAWVLFVTVRVPGFNGTPETVETIALVCKAGELIGIALALPLGWPGLLAAGRRARPDWNAVGTPRLDRSAR